MQLEFLDTYKYIKLAEWRLIAFWPNGPHGLGKMDWVYVGEEIPKEGDLHVCRADLRTDPKARWPAVK